MKVKLLVPICGPDGSFKAGDEPDLAESIAMGLITGGYAEALEPFSVVEELKAGEPDEPEDDNAANDGTNDTDGSEATPKSGRKRR